MTEHDDEGDQLTTHESVPSDFHLETRWLGDGERPVVFLHGLMGRGRNFATAAKSLAATHRSLLVDLPNHGDSDWTDRFDYVEHSELVAAALQPVVAEHGAVTLVGHSMGGKVAMVLALRHPALVERLAVVDISPVRHESSSTEFEHLLGSMRALDLSQIGSRSEADSRLAEEVGHPTVRGFLLQNLRRADGNFEWQPNLELLYASLDEIAQFPDFDGATFDKPVAWIAGELSDYIKAEYEPTMRAYFPRANRVTIKGAGHWVHSQQPEIFHSVLQHFVETEA